MVRADLTYEQACSLPDPKQITIDGDGKVIVETQPPPPPIPQTVTLRQARIILERYGLLDTINSRVAAMGGEAVITWEYSSEVQRDNPLVSAVGVAAGMTAAQIDQMFIEASRL